MRNYLPSKQFTVRVIILLAAVGLFFGIRAIIIYFHNKKELAKVPSKILVKDLVQKDTNENGIPDWEESLWGLDPTKDGPENKAVIIAKREELSKTAESDMILGNEPSKETENLSKELFAVIISLQESGNLDENAMKEISNAIGEKIVPSPIPDIYKENMIITRAATEKSLNDYYEAFKKLVDKYADKDIGNELIFISQGVKNNDPQAVSVVSDVALAYRAFGKELSKVPVPDSIAEYHLQLANDYEKVAQSIEGLAVLLDDPIIGMKSLINYKKYNDELVNNIQNISDNL